MHSDVQRILLSGDEIAERVTEIAETITRDYAGESVLMVGILRGAVVFFAELVKKIDLDLRFDFMVVSSYGSSTDSSGEVRIVKDLSQPIEGMNVIIVEDIIDTGYTLKNLMKLLRTRNPKSLKICALLDKPSRRKVELEGDYVGFKVPNEFVVGYGLDYNEKYRNLPDICILKPEIYS
ncbi:MAG: hypoxanthine phosphoribosyltransferase [Firmicutes bacterium]|uniref:Hypoxanthine phosphoribosyltransferase n=1 Tax=Candidatus Stercoripulliclostridium pullicola TaxID=2840953 RepID=A0A940DGJ3_9FIRM|nr:hypoxanthine phosphoribosyltransferase [Candidatus Stercoripulliclostridium pullicola]